MFLLNKASIASLKFYFYYKRMYGHFFIFFVAPIILTGIFTPLVGEGYGEPKKNDTVTVQPVKFASFDDVQVKRSRSNADKLSKKALWSKCITYYDDAYDFALRKAELRK